MSEIEFVGLFFLTVVPIIASIIALVRYFTKPMIDLNTNIVELKDSIKSLNKDITRQDHRLDIHGQRLDNIEVTVNRHDVEIAHLKHEVDKKK